MRTYSVSEMASWPRERSQPRVSGMIHMHNSEVISCTGFHTPQGIGKK